MEDAFPGLHKNSWGQWQAGQGASRGPGGPPYRTRPLRKGTQGVYPFIGIRALSHFHGVHPFGKFERERYIQAVIIWAYKKFTKREVAIPHV